MKILWTISRPGVLSGRDLAAARDLDPLRAQRDVASAAGASLRLSIRPPHERIARAAYGVVRG